VLSLVYAIAPSLAVSCGEDGRPAGGHDPDGGAGRPDGSAGAASGASGSAGVGAASGASGSAGVGAASDASGGAAITDAVSDTGSVDGRAGSGGASDSGSDSGGSAGTDAGVVPEDAPIFDFRRRPNLAVSYQIDPAHSGAQPDGKFVPPLTQRWSYSFDGAVSYPLIVDGRVFVTAQGEGNLETKLYALDAESGRLLWQSEAIGGQFESHDVNPAYDRGKVFVASDGGELFAFDAASGVVAWKIQLPEVYAFTTLPLAAGGVVFITGAVNSGEPLFAIDGSTGRVLYDAESIGGRPLTLGESTLFNGAGCYETDALDARSGTQLWHFKTGCSGGGSQPTTYHRGQLFVPESVISVLDAVTGAQRRFMLNGFWAPACDGDTGFLVVGSELSGVDLRDARMRWKLSLGESAAYDHHPAMPPLVVNGFVYVVTFSGKLSAVAAATGKVFWSEQVAPKDLGWVDSGGAPMRAMGAGEERLIVPFQRRIYAYF